MFICKNDRCRDVFDTWIVQVNADGSIPMRRPGAKEFPNPDRMNVMGERYIDHLKEEVARAEYDK